jgi:hypothetical protein
MVLPGPAVAAALAALAGVGVNADAPDPAPTLIVCITAPPDLAVHEARERTDRIFAAIGIALVWQRGHRECPFDGVRMTFSTGTPAAIAPGAFGRSFPYDGTRVDVFYDRIRAAAPPSHLPAVLAHVVAHELVHVAQAVSRHAPEGLMKARWERGELSAMAWRTLPFTPEDVILIRRGLTTRLNRLRARLDANAERPHDR